MKKWFIYCTILLASACTSSLTKTKPVALSVIPAPQEIQYLNGTFTLNEKTSLQIPAQWSTLEDILNSNIQIVSHYKLTNGNSSKNSIQLKIDTSRISSPEGYQLNISPQSIRITGRTEAGLFYGLQTLRQILNDERFYHPDTRSWQIPALEIQDYPTFPYRGMHLDVSRHFFPKEYILKWIDLMALYKINTLHWRGMAGRDQEIPRTDPYSSMENPDRLERMVDRQGSAISGRRHTRGVRGILHARGYTGDRGLRYRSTRGDHSRNRNAGTLRRSIGHLPRVILFR